MADTEPWDPSESVVKAVRGEYGAPDDSSREVELILYGHDESPLLSIPISSIIAVTRNSLHPTSYHILSLYQVEQDGSQAKEMENPPPAEKSRDTAPGELGTKGAPPVFRLKKTVADSLPEKLLAQFLEQPESGLKVALAEARNTSRGEASLRPSIHVLLSPVSGTGLAREFYEQILQPLLTGLFGFTENEDFDVHETTDPRDETAENFSRDVLLPAANKGEKRTVLLLSGDGGIVDLLNGPFGRSTRESTYVAPTICLLPLGTGNALFHSLHRPTTLLSPGTTTNPLVNSLRNLLTGSPHPLPTFTASFSPGARILINESREAIPFPKSLDPAQPNLNAIYGTVVASYGFHATLVADSDTVEYRKHGIARFGMIANELLGNGPHAYKCRVTTSLHPSRPSSSKPKLLAGDTKEFGYILNTLVSNLEQTFTISSESKPLDGVLRTVCFGNEPAPKVMELMGGAYAGGKHVEDPSVAYEPVESLRVDLEEEGDSWKWRRCCIDGLIVAIEEGGWMDVRNGGPGNGLLEIVAPMK